MIIHDCLVQFSQLSDSEAITFTHSGSICRHNSDEALTVSRRCRTCNTSNLHYLINSVGTAILLYGYIHTIYIKMWLIVPAMDELDDLFE